MIGGQATLPLDKGDRIALYSLPLRRGRLFPKAFPWEAEPRSHQA